MRQNYVFFDIGFYEDCNLKCEYCRDHYIRNTNKFSLNDLEQEVKLVKAHYKIAVVKISGYGEITTWKAFEKAIEFLSNEFPSVQIITNGTFSEKTLLQISKYDNISVNITIDGHTLEMNSYRVGESTQLHNTVLRNVCEVIKLGIPLEINSVLHNRNIGEYILFLEYINSIRHRGKVLVFPFPVKVFERTKYNNNPITIDRERLFILIDEWWRSFPSILPHYEYAKDLKDFCLSGRTKICHVNWINIGTGGKDERLLCPNYGDSLSMGDFRSSFDKLEECELIERHYANIQLGVDCSMCFNHYHILNLFLEDRITIEDLRRIPSLSSQESIKIIKKVKEEYESL